MDPFVSIFTLILQDFFTHGRFCTCGVTHDILAPNNKIVHVSTVGGLEYGIYVSSLIYRILGNSDVLVKQFIRSFSGVALLAWIRLPSRPS